MITIPPSTIPASFCLLVLKIVLSCDCTVALEEINKSSAAKTVKNLVNENINFSIIIFDLDHFKKINDRYGHQEGNNVISALCSNIYKIIPENSVFGRYGGDEFIIVLLDEDKQEAVQLAELIRLIVEKTKFDALGRNATISVGVASSTETEKLEVLNIADKLLYKAKENGRNRIEYIR